MKLLQQQQRTIQLQILYDKLIRMLQLIIHRESDKVEGSIRDLVIFEVETVITWQWLSDKDYVQIEEGNSDYIGLKWMLFEKQRVTKWLVCIWTTLLFVTGSSRLHWMNMLMNDWQKRRLESWYSKQWWLMVRFYSCYGVSLRECFGKFWTILLESTDCF